jgi:hypothetical protein
VADSGGIGTCRNRLRTGLYASGLALNWKFWRIDRYEDGLLGGVMAIESKRLKIFLMAVLSKGRVFLKKKIKLELSDSIT